MANKYSKIFTEFCLKTTSHGIANILNAKNFVLKILWIVFVLIASSLSIYAVKNSISKYLEFEVVTKTTFKKVFKTEFPTITICNRNLFTKPEEKIYFDENYEKIQNLTFEDKLSFFSNLAYNLKMNYNITIGLKLEELIIDCSFNLKKCDYDNDFVEEYYIFSGTCFRFNSGKHSNGHNIALKNVNEAGIIGGLRLKVYTGNSETSFPSESTGIQIIIHNSTIRPSAMEGLMIPNGLETNIALNRLFIHKKEKPYSNCISDIQNYIPDFMSQEFSQKEYEYLQHICLKLCYQSLLIKKLGCYNPAFNKLNCTKPCLSPADIINERLFYLNEFSKNYIFSYCEPLCPLECNSIKYNTLISHGNFPNSYYLNVSGLKYTSIDHFRKSHLSLNIFYESLEYTTLEEIAKTELIDLISGIGGTMGLFIGISVLSIAEVFELIFLLFEAFLKKERVLPFDKNSK